MKLKSTESVQDSNSEILSVVFPVGLVRWLPTSVTAMKERESTASHNLNRVLSSPKPSPPEIQFLLIINEAQELVCFKNSPGYSNVQPGLRTAVLGVVST